MQLLLFATHMVMAVAASALVGSCACQWVLAYVLTVLACARARRLVVAPARYWKKFKHPVVTKHVRWRGVGPTGVWSRAAPVWPCHRPPVRRACALPDPRSLRDCVAQFGAVQAVNFAAAAPHDFAVTTSTR